MASFNNLFANQNSTSTVLATINKPAFVASTSQVVDPQIDVLWGGNTPGFTGPDAAISPYSTYYFSGQDISVSIDGTQANTAFQNIPVVSLQFQISQPKLAIYGFWSYTYDAIAYGARQVAARIEIATTYPGYMTALLKEVAKERLANTNGAYANSAPLSTDDQNILAFWGGSGAPTNQTGQTINLYQEHPPFDIIIIYGNQPTSVSTLGSLASADAGNNPLFVDTNEQLVEPASSSGVSQRLILQACEITNMGTMYDTSGNLICEAYDLIVNDINIPS